MSERTKKIVVIAVIGFFALSMVRGITGRFSHNTIDTQNLITEQFDDADEITEWSSYRDYDQHRRGRHHHRGVLFLLLGLVRSVLMGLGVLFLFKLIRRGRHRGGRGGGRGHGPRDHDGGPPPGFRRGGRHRRHGGDGEGRWSNDDEDIEINIDPDGENDQDQQDADKDMDADALKKKLKKKAKGKK